MAAQDIIRQLQTLSHDEIEEVRLWIDDQFIESPEFLAAVDEGIADLEAGRVTVYSREELTEKIKTWAGGSR